MKSSSKNEMKMKKVKEKQQCNAKKILFSYIFKEGGTFVEQLNGSNVIFPPKKKNVSFFYAEAQLKRRNK